jgi:hypothetical protein
MKKYSTNISNIQKTFNEEISHYKMLNFVGNTLGLNFEEYNKKSKLIVEIKNVELWKNKLSKNFEQQEVIKEQDVIIRFEVKNQESEKFSLQIIENKKIIFEQIYLPHYADEKETTTDRKFFLVGEHKITWNCASNGIFDDRDSKRKLLFKVIVVGFEKQVSFGAKTIELKSFLKSTKYYNSTEFDKNRVVVWLSKSYTPSKELLHTTSSLPTIVYAGAKLIRLKPDKESEKTPCFFWWNNEYHIQEFPEELLGDSNEIPGEFINEVFQNDLQHTAHRATFIQNANASLLSLIQKVHEKKNKGFSKAQIISTYKSLNQTLQINLSNKVETIGRLLSEIRKIYDPVDENGKMFDQILFVPLTKEWFMKYGDDVKLRYVDFWENNNGYNSISAENGGGEVFSKSYDPSCAQFIDELKNLLQLNFISEERKDTDEWSWILSMNDINVDQLLHVIVLSLDCWIIDDSISFASGIGLEHTFSLIRIPRPLTVLLHETSQTSFTKPPIPKDSHTRNTEDSWNKLSANYSNFSDDEYDLISRIYVSDYQIALVELMIILNNIP